MDRVLALIGDPAPWRVPWALDRGSAAEFIAHLDTHGSRTVVEAGSGSSTLLLGLWAAATGGTVTSLEHDPAWHAKTLALLERHGVAGHVDLRYAPLRDTPAGPWYDTALPDAVDAVLVDGPPGGLGGRGAALPELLPHLADGWALYLHDAGRPGEQTVLRDWQRAHGVTVTVAQQLARVTARPVAPAPVDATDVAVTVLTGARPALLERTLASVEATAPGLLGTAHVTVLRHSGDQGTAGVIYAHRAVIDEVLEVGDPPMIGDAWTTLMGSALAAGRRWVLHLEDDWESVTFHASWLDHARRVLADRGDVTQVKARHRREWVLPHHMVTREPLVWHPDAAHRCLVADAHWTFNPALMRCADVAEVLAGGSGDHEKAVQRLAHRLGYRGCAQLLPGVFAHIGGVTGGPDSVRHRTACADQLRRT